MKIFKILVVILAIFSSACATKFSFTKGQTENKRLMRRAIEYYDYQKSRNFEAIWEMSSPYHKGDKESYISAATILSKKMPMVFEYRDLHIVFSSNNLIVTKADTVTFYPDHKFETCQLIVWLRLPNNWYFGELHFDCNYIPDEEDIERLTKNLPSR